MSHCANCGKVLVLHRIGDDACPIIDGEDLSFMAGSHFAPKSHEPSPPESAFLSRIEGEMKTWDHGDWTYLNDVYATSESLLEAERAFVLAAIRKALEGK